MSENPGDGMDGSNGPTENNPPPRKTVEEIIQEKVFTIFKDAPEGRRLVADFVKKAHTAGAKADEKAQMDFAKRLQKPKILRAFLKQLK